MSTSEKYTALSPELYDWSLAHGVREHPVLAECREATAKMGQISRMQIAPDQGAFMGLLVKLMGAKRIVEFGSFTGYSSLAMALALPRDGALVALDRNGEWTKQARKFWDKAGVADRITLRLGDAAETLKTMLPGEAGSYDLAFIDADKPGYDTYYEACLDLVRPGGAILVDNTFFQGLVLSPADSENAQAIVALMAKIKSDERVEIANLPIGDGVLLALVR